MIRRALFAAALAALSLGSARAEDAPATQTKPWDWVFVYYMNYDNNLEPCGRPILDMLKAGVVSDRVVVTCQADFRDTDGLRRYVITKAGGETCEQLADQENSADEETLAAYLEWVKQRFPGKKYALVFLDHGGALAEMSNDGNPGREGGQKWLEVTETAQVVAAWNKTLDSPLELLFLQQCGKGGLENYHAFRGAAKVLMGSQTPVGAPNSYYAATVKWAGEHPEADGQALAATIRETESPRMFTTYSAFHAAALEELPARLAPVLEPLLARGDQLALPRGIKSCFQSPPDELFFDGLQLLRALYQQNELDAAPVDAFDAWAKEKLLAGHKVSPLRVQVAGDWCGYSIYFPVTGRAIDRYAHYPLFKETRLPELFRALQAARKKSLPAGAPRKGQ